MKKGFIILSVIFAYTMCLGLIINIPADQTTIQAGVEIASPGDTLLVQPGTYLENIVVHHKNITIGSLFLTTQDTTYISQTILDGNAIGSVITYYAGNDSINASALQGFTIQNGESYKGGAIRSGASTTTFSHLIVKNSNANYGGGFWSESGHPIIEDCLFEGNSAEVNGGGLSFGKYSNAKMQNVVVRNNQAPKAAGVGLNEESTVEIIDSIIKDNIATQYGGGIYLDYYCTLILRGSSIHSNSATQGGGIYTEIANNTIAFDPENRSSLYSNTIFSSRGNGADIFAYDCDVIVDTFTTLTPTDYYASPLANLSFDILNEVGIDLLEADLFVAPEGDNGNTGLTEDSPFKTIQYAMSKLYSDSLNIRAIYLAAGTYSGSTNGETFPLNISDFTVLCGDTAETTILDGENNSTVISSKYNNNVTIKDLKITNGSAKNGGGIYLYNTNVLCDRLILESNTAEDRGGAIDGFRSELELKNSMIINNISGLNGGGINLVKSDGTIDSCYIAGNSSTLFGGGICCYSEANIELSNLTIENNIAAIGGGIACLSGETATAENLIIRNNHATEDGGGVFSNGFAFSFDDDNRCSIYGNTALNLGNDVYSNEAVTISLNIASVLEPDSYFLYPIENFEYDISMGLIEQVAQDLYVDPEGSNDNSGISSGDPLQTISYALKRVKPDSLNPLTIHLSEGVFSANPEEESFPINLRSFVSVKGANENTTILDGEEQYRVMHAYMDSMLTISNLKITNGFSEKGGAINCSQDSNIKIENAILENNSADKGGAIYCYSSSPCLDGVTLKDNHATSKGGGLCSEYNGNPNFMNSTIRDNSAHNGGGVYLYFANEGSLMQNVQIFNNYASIGGGITFSNSNYLVENSSIFNNGAANYGGGIDCIRSELEMNNVILAHNSAIINGGGIRCLLYSDLICKNVIIKSNNCDQKGGGIYCDDNYYIWFKNTVIAENESGANGAGICAEYCSSSEMHVDNSIIWDNTVYGASNIFFRYSNLEDICAGEGNISVDPLFMEDSEQLYVLAENSPCIDAGKPSSSYNDPEDPFNPGFARYPAQGTVRNDIGAYGGPLAMNWEFVEAPDDEIELPQKISLSNYPNPFNPTTTIAFSLPDKAIIDISIYNIKGQKVKTILNEQLSSGEHTAIWNGADKSNRAVASGVYFYRLTVNGKGVKANKCLLLK